MTDEISHWTAELTAALGPRLASLTLYGSHATDAPHAADRPRLCLELDPCDAESLRAVGGVLAGAVRRGRVHTYVVAKGELARLCDVFPLRIYAMRAEHRVLHGHDPLTGLAVGRERLRTAVEQGLRNHLVRLRAHFLLHDGDAVATIGVLRAIAEGIGDDVAGLAVLGVDSDSDVPRRLEAVRDGDAPDERLLGDALAWVGAMAERVDRLEDA